MCTLTIIPLSAAPPGRAGAGGFRLVTNRDESRRRPPALAPAHQRARDGVRALWPTDAQAGGAWVAASERGLVLSLLNMNPTPPPPLPARDDLTTRGVVIPALIDSPGARDALARLADAPLDAFAPFRLVAADAGAVLEARWDRDRLSIVEHPLVPLCFVSSGLGDALVEPRLSLFREWFAETPATPGAQDAFHRHVWPDRPEISVRMSRDDARTVSTTVVEAQWSADACRIAMTYIDDAGTRRLELVGRHRSLAGATVGRV